MKKKYVFTLIYILLISCSKNDFESDISLEFNNFKINENLALIAQPISFSKLRDGSLVLITEKNQIIKYDNFGNQIKIIDVIGQGELELFSPSIVHNNKEGFMIWCRDLLKMVAFDSEGNPIEEFFGFNHSIKKFVVKENLIFT
ncbi:hypothetical protein [Belliella pelovolcani]|uniref:hypothetical protein n=1 Tax=Belliella pelovolcani TaxID=529505 RepID=UPI00391B2D0B